MFSLIPWPYRILAMGLLCVALFAAGYVKGARAEQLAAVAADRDSMLRVVKIERRQAAVSNAIAVAHETGRTRDRLVYRTIEKEIIRYVANPARLVARLDRSWVCQHDAGALSGLPDTACILDASASDFTSDDALRVLVRNYEAAKENERQLIDLQAWIRAQGALEAT
ncbi:hypothetical protein FNU76_10145 [Chitinimonas arctica]|uniref:Uncharacterized protein n=1 Tax=Chitinimonas arctica TaxID=2594795 RepID=A0A516SEV5_9NEIS|nr:hypothetical protein [Chitinimonas arctica]QDQ26694.1 hypothetical protein FNU76_10145 [Chitinimonas arctica]